MVTTMTIDQQINYMITHKQCGACHASLPLSHYQSDVSKDDGLHTACRNCHDIRNITANAVSAIVYKQAGGVVPFYWLDRQERLRRRNMVKRYVASVGIAKFPRTRLPKPYVPAADPKRVERTTTQLSRAGQSAFTRAILRRDKMCVVSGTPVDTYVYSKGQKVALVHAAHIKPLVRCDKGQYWDRDNGLAMRADLHMAFDCGLFTIDGDGMIFRSRWLYSPVPVGVRLRVDLTEGQKEYLKGHRLWAFRNWDRWAL